MNKNNDKEKIIYEENIESINNYFNELREKTLVLYNIANQARKKGYDPIDKVEIPLAKDIAERVEGLISVKVPEIAGKGIPERIRELEKKYGQLDWRVAMTIAKEVAEGKFHKFEDKVKGLETGVRIGLAYITMGTVSAPIEGFVEMKEKKRKDGSPYLAVYFAGPIRGAGGTAAAVSVLLADYLRYVFNYPKYDPTEEEIKRYQIEIQDYHERVARLQYYPSPQEIEFLIKHIGVEINGIPTSDKQVSNFKDLPRVETNRIRGGMCLVIGEGLAQKAKKMWKKLKKWGESFGFTEWNWLEQFLELQSEIKAKLSGADKKEENKEKEEKKKKEKIKPDFTYIKELAAGRPVFGYPLRFGGFRLRYGRVNLSGFAAQGVHPATMEITYKFLAVGTQMKTERPGKGTITMPVDSIEGPIVKLRNGEVKRIEDIKEAEQIIKTKQLSKILFLGDLLIAYGDFKANGHKLIPAGYNEEWWLQDVLETLDNELREELINYLEKKCRENKEVNA
ncbi:MAG: DNA polymerase II large subunit, partial [Nanoarchaeota archaeon]